MSQPRIRIPMHVFVFGMAMLPPTAYAYYWKRNAPTDEELEELLRKNYSNQIQQSKQKREQMQKHFQQFQADDTDTNKQYMEILQSGKGTVKRHYHVDESLYGTEEGAKRIEEEMKKVGKKKKKKKESKDEERETILTKDKECKTNDVADVDSAKDIVAEPSTESRRGENIATIVAVGTIAGLVGVLIGKSGSSSR